MAESKVVRVDPKYSQEDVQRALAHMEKTKAQNAAWRAKAKTPEGKAKAQAAAARRRAVEQLIILKAKEKGITVTAEEVDKFLAKKAAAPAPAGA